MDIKTNAAGAVLPPGTAPAAAELSAGGYEVRIDGFDDSGLIRCVYPDGFIKHHQAETVEELAGKVASQIKGRYGASEVKFTSAPKALKAGQAFSVEG